MAARQIARHRHLVSAVAALSAAGLGAAPSALADDSSYTFLWFVTTTEKVAYDDGISYTDEIDFQGAPLQRGGIIFYGYMMGNFPYAGPHQLLLDPGWIDEHLQEVEKDINHYMPDPLFDGPAMIDYEGWHPLWELTNDEPSNEPIDARDLDFKTDWRETVEMLYPDMLAGLSPEQQDQVLCDFYEETAREFYLVTIERCKELRPNALWGYYRYPKKLYTSPELTDIGVIGYGDLTYYASDLNDKLSWLYDASRALYPSLYAVRITVEGTPNPAASENSMDANFQYLYTNVAEAVRVANGKPVYPLIAMGYQMPGVTHSEDNWLNDINTRQSLEVPALAGAAGVAIWGAINDPEYFEEVQAFVSQTLAPAVIEVNQIVNGGAMPPVDDPADDAQADSGQSSTPKAKGRSGGSSKGTVGSVRTSRRDGTVPDRDKLNRMRDRHGELISRPRISAEEAAQALDRARRDREGAGSNSGDDDSSSKDKP